MTSSGGWANKMKRKSCNHLVVGEKCRIFAEAKHTIVAFATKLDVSLHKVSYGHEKERFCQE